MGKASRLKDTDLSQVLKSDKTKTEYGARKQIVKDKAHEHLSAEELEEQSQRAEIR